MKSSRLAPHASRLILSDWILGISYGVLLVAAMAAAEGRWGDAASPILPVADSGLISEAEIPTDDATWAGCCDHRDCMEAKINVAYQAGDLARVAISAYPIFELEAAKIFRSTNGKSYFCRSDLTKPPDRENTRCVFHGLPLVGFRPQGGAPRYVRR